MIPVPKPSGCLPAFLHTPAGNSNQRAPWLATPQEVVACFGSSKPRLRLIRNWLQHCLDIYNVAPVEGWQWLAGSFVEDDACRGRPPADIDVVLFYTIPNNKQASDDLSNRNDLLDRNEVKQKYDLDLFVLEGPSQLAFVVEFSCYYFGLFSHRRNTMEWKGFLKVALDHTGRDAAAWSTLRTLEAEP